MTKLKKFFSECVVEHQMLSNGDHVMVGLSGGKDSWALLGLLSQLQKKAPVQFSISAVTVDGGLVGLDTTELERGCAKLNVPFHLVRQNIFETVADKKEEGSTFCSMCAKLRRGALYSFAEKIGATKIALGHHLDDAIETLLLNLFYGGRSAALPPVLISNAGHVPIIRPLLYCSETDLREYAQEQGFNAIGCACPVCPTHPEYEYSDLKRHQIKKWVTQLSAEIPNLRDSARTALRNIRANRYFDVNFAEKLFEVAPLAAKRFSA